MARQPRHTASLRNRLLFRSSPKIRSQSLPAETMQERLAACNNVWVVLKVRGWGLARLVS